MAPDMRSTAGSVGEAAALQAYRNLGYRLVERNWRCGLGELDLIVTRPEILVFCEVKTRRGTMYGGGYEAVTWRKRAKLRSLAEAFLQERGARTPAVRFDVASVSLGPHGPHVELFEDAF